MSLSLIIFFLSVMLKLRPPFLSQVLSVDFLFATSAIYLKCLRSVCPSIISFENLRRYYIKLTPVIPNVVWPQVPKWS